MKPRADPGETGTSGGRAFFSAGNETYAWTSSRAQGGCSMADSARVRRSKLIPKELKTLSAPPHPPTNPTNQPPTIHPLCQRESRKRKADGARYALPLAISVPIRCSAGVESGCFMYMYTSAASPS